MVLKQFCTLIDMLAYRAAHDHQRIAFTFEGEPTTYGALMMAVNRFAAVLNALDIEPGDRIVLVLPNGPEFFCAFYGIQRIGGIAVPLFPGSGVERVLSIAASCGATTIVVPGDTPADQLAGFRKISQEHSLHVLTAAETCETDCEIDFPTIDPHAIAFLQYTSGSTGNPKGVQLTHDNIITNMVQMIEGMEITAEDIFVSWLPVYHDLGLIIMSMIPFYVGTVVHLQSTNLREVRSWLQTIQDRRGTYTAAPDFAYRLCLRHVNPEDYDLSSLRVALNAAEPVRASTVRDFESAFHLKGVMAPGYGLAEATVGVSMWVPGTTPHVDDRGFVSVGPPFPGISVKIVKEGVSLPTGKVGEIAFLSPANSSGYYNNSEETRKLVLKDDYNLSGDLGYLDEDGYLYVVGRVKNIIKLAGDTISPGEIEEIVDRTAAVRYSAIVGVDWGGSEGEQVYVFAEIRDGATKTDNELIELTLEIVNAVHDRMGFRPGRVYLLHPRAIPLTYNGKIQHGRLKEKYLDGSLRTTGKIFYPEY